MTLVTVEFEVFLQICYFNLIKLRFNNSASSSPTDILDMFTNFFEQSYASLSNTYGCCLYYLETFDAIPNITFINVEAINIFNF